jgi:hypothetical protein
MDFYEEIPLKEGFTTACYGVAIRVVDAAGAGVTQRLRDMLAPEFVAGDGATSLAASYVVTTDTRATAEQSGYRVSRDGSVVFVAATEEDVVAWLCQDIDNTVAQRSQQMLFVHAGVIGWRGLAIVVPGRSYTGKSTLVAEMVRRGAVYYSDEFAVLDDMGMVHAYRRPLGLRRETPPSPDLRLSRGDASPEPLAIAVVVAGPYQPEIAWRPAVVRGARAVLPLIDGTVLGREESARMLRIAARLAPGMVTLQGPRPEATDVAAELLDLVDDALVSQALGAGTRDSPDLPADLARVAEMRLLSRDGRPAPTPRQLQTTRYMRVMDFLVPAEHRRLLDHVLAHQGEFQESGIVGPDGELGVLDYGVRRSRTLYNQRLEEMWEMFERRLAGILPAVRRELGMPWFFVDKVERQLTVHGIGDFFGPHVDTGSAIVAKRRISCVYYFHETPQRFTGGELKLYDTWVTPSGSTGAPTHTTLAPVDNSIVFFPSDAFHEVCPVHADTEAFGNSRFTVTIWFHEGKRPVRLDGVDAP